MCGILGGDHPKWDYEKGIRSMQHRGPDGTRTVSMGNVTLAFARLAVMDLSEQAMQPMFSEDRQVCLVFNGEIYGYQGLRNGLIKKGYHFRSTSDTEVVLNAYLEWGEGFITKVDGMFGMAIYDARDGMLRLFRDRSGIKPLYYHYDGRYFGFASELKGIISMCSTSAFEIDHTAVYDLLNYLYIPDTKTFYKNVYKLLPGHRMTVDLKKGRIVKDSAYWKLDINPYQGAQRDQDELVEELRHLIRLSVREQMVADVPVGTFLSGGVDSSVVTYEGYQVNPQLETFSMGFTKPQCNELPYARELAGRYQIHMNTQVFDQKLFHQYYNKMKIWYDEPFADISAFPTYLVSKLAREKVTVVLTGDGGDEVFGGYPIYGIMRRKEQEHGPDNLLISYFYDRFGNGKRKYFWLDDLGFLLSARRWELSESDRRLRKCLGIPKDYDRYWALRKYYIKDLPPMTRVQFLDLHTYLPGDILTKVDRASMAVSLETRVPLLSKRLVEFSFSLSEEDRCPAGETKGLFKKAYEEEFGKRFLYRRKQGFGIPYEYFGEGRSAQEHILEHVWQIKV